MKTALMIGALIGAAFFSYRNTLSGQFVYDDHVVIVKNPLIRDLQHIPLIFNSPY